MLKTFAEILFPEAHEIQKTFSDFSQFVCAQLLLAVMIIDCFLLLETWLGFRNSQITLIMLDYFYVCLYRNDTSSKSYHTD